MNKIVEFFVMDLFGFCATDEQVAKVASAVETHLTEEDTTFLLGLSDDDLEVAVGGEQSEMAEICGRGPEGLDERLDECFSACV